MVDMNYPFWLDRILTPSLTVLLSALIGIQVGKHLERRKLAKDFDLPYYQQLYPLVQNVNALIQRGEPLNHQELMRPIQQQYSCKDLQDFLFNFVRPDDAKIRQLLDQFSLNMVDYQNARGREDLKAFKTSSRDISENILKRIKRLVVH